MKHEKKPKQQPEKETVFRLSDEMLQSLVEENVLFDDHGTTIIGARNRKPVHPEND